MRRILTAVGAAVIGTAIATAPRVLRRTIVGRWLGITEPEVSRENDDPPASGSRKRAGNRPVNPEKRFEKHMASGKLSSRIVRKYGVRLLPHLYEHLNPAPKAERKEREESLALDLQGRRAIRSTILLSARSAAGFR